MVNPRSGTAVNRAKLRRAAPAGPRSLEPDLSGLLFLGIRDLPGSVHQARGGDQEDDQQERSEVGPGAEQDHDPPMSRSAPKR